MNIKTIEVFKITKKTPGYICFPAAHLFTPVLSSSSINDLSFIYTDEFLSIKMRKSSETRHKDPYAQQNTIT
jgi:hypothetical protein